MPSKIHAEQHFDCTAQELFDLLIDDDFDTALMAAAGVKREAVASEDRARGPWQRLKMTPNTKLPGFMKKAVSIEHYFQQRQWDRDQLGYDWTVELGVGGDKIDVAGTLRVVEDPKGGCRRIIDGDVTVKIALIGGKIEKFVVKQTSEGFIKGEAFIKERLAKG